MKNQLPQTRSQRRYMERKQDEYFALKAFEVTIYKESEQFWVIAIHVDHVKELLLQCPEEIKPEDIDSMRTLNYEEMKAIHIAPNEEQELPETTLFEVFTNYKGHGEIICSTVYND